MNHSPLSDDLQSLAAGYVLGDLSSEEMAQFQQLLTTHPELTRMVESLQETLSLLSYGLPPQTPDAQVRSRLLGAAQASVVRTSNSSLSVSPPIEQPSITRRRRSAWATRWAAVLAIGFGGCSLWLTYRVVTLQAQLKTAQDTVMAIADTAAGDVSVREEPLADKFATAREPETMAESGQAEIGLEREVLVVSPADAFLQQQWTGLSQLVQDHRQSLVRSQGPVDIAARNPGTLLGQLPLSDQIPAIASPQATLLGGSHCQFGAAKGVRLTYQLPADQTVSVYQIDLEGEHFPKLPEANITLNYRNINLILWREENYLYALAAELPLADLQTLAQTMEPI